MRAKKFLTWPVIFLCVLIFSACAAYGALTRPARVAIEFQYDDARDFHEGLAAVKKGGNWGYIDIHGTVIISLTHKVLEPGDFSEGLAFLGDHYIDIDGNPAFISEENPAIKFFSRGREFVSGLAAVQIGNMWGFIDLTGNFAIAPLYQDVQNFSEGLAAVKLDNKWGYIDMMGHLIIPYQFLRAGSFHNGLAKFYTNGRYGYINKEGKTAIKPAFYEAGDFNNGLAPVRMKTNYRGWGFINTSGRFVIRRKYNFATEFSDGLAGVAGDARYGFINARGEWEYSPFYDGVRKFSEGFAAVRQNGKWGYIMQ